MSVVLGVDVPDVAECHGHYVKDASGHSVRSAAACAQCDGSHDHNFVVVAIPKGRWPNASSDYALRCLLCGARACAAIADSPFCTLRRHHAEPHAYSDGSIRPVGA